MGIPCMLYRKAMWIWCFREFLIPNPPVYVISSIYVRITLYSALAFKNVKDGELPGMHDNLKPRLNTSQTTVVVGCGFENIFYNMLLQKLIGFAK